MTVNVSRRRAARAMLFLAMAFAFLAAAPAGHAASLPKLTAIPTVTGPNVSCQSTTCDVFDTDHAKNGESAVFDGSNSTTDFVTGAPIVSYAWILKSTSTGAIVNEVSTPNPTFQYNGLLDDIYVLTLIVSDGTGTSSSDLTLRVAGPSVAVISTPTQTIADSDKLPGETLTLQSTGSVFGDCFNSGAGTTSTTRRAAAAVSAGTACTNPTYNWTINGKSLGINQASPTVRLNDGANVITLTISDNAQASLASAPITITVVAPPPTAVIANGDRTVGDSDGKPGETVTFDGSGSSAPDGATITRYDWTVNDVAVPGVTGAQASLPLKDGVNKVLLSVTDSLGGTGSTFVTVTVTSAQAPTAVIAGGNRTVADSDGKPGESVSFDGRSSTAESGATITTYTWSVNSTVVTQASGPTPTLPLKDGSNTVSLVVTDSRGQQSEAASVTITVNGAQALTATIVGGNRSVADVDGLPDERVSFVGTATGTGGTAVPDSAFAWAVTAVVQGQTATVDSAQGTSRPTLRLRDGANTVTLTVTDPASGLVSHASVVIRVAGSNVEGAPSPLSSIAGLTANQKSVAQAIERSCSDLTAKYESGALLATGQTDLLQQCRALINDHASAQDVPVLQATLDSLSGQQVTAMQRMGLEFSDSQFKNLGDRLTELRRGQHGMSVAGVHVQGGTVELPLAELASVVGKMVGGGAGDEAPLSDLLQDRFGVFVTGNLRVGDRQATDREAGFGLDSHSVTAGLDYRFTDTFVAGAALGYSRAKSEFATPQSRIDSKNLTASLYGSWYVGEGYLDFILTHGKLDYDSSRNIAFNSSVVTAVNGIVDRTAVGATSGRQTAVGITTGYDWHWRGLTTGPVITLNYTRVDINAFGESGADGLNLSFDDQLGESFTLKAGGHASYAVNTRFGVFMPHVQASGVHEFASTARAVTGRFQADVASAFSILTDDPDRDYFNWSAGVSAQFPFGIAAFIDHQALAGLDRTSVHDTSMGLRIMTHF